MGFNILLVDDSATTRKVMAKTFRLASIPINELYEAANGQEALALLKSHWIDVVFADINMPVMDGEELVNRMSQDGLLKTVPVILVSIEGSATRIDQLKAKGVSAFVRKPFTPEMLSSVLNSVMWPKTHAGNREQLAQVFSQVLEQYAFMFSETVSRDQVAEAGPDYLEAAIDFTGQISGRLLLVMPATLGPQIAANVLGTEPEDKLALAESEDALRELINVTCGQLLTTMAGEKPIFDMSVPVVSRLKKDAWQDLLQVEDTVVFMVEENPVLLRLCLGVHKA
ncbi:MAG: response regulator [Kiritimatiellae bacterium]|nr:response regulator [Kiritimatiellia bacterium]